MPTGMRYYLTAEDGQRYGPADEDTLRAWANQGRLTPQTLLEPEAGGPTINAGSMPGLQFPPVTKPYGPNQTPGAYAPGPGYSPPQPFYTRAPNLGVWSAWEVPTAWGLGLMAAVGILCGLAPCFAALGIIVSVIGLVQGRRTMAPLILCIAALILQFLWLRSAGSIDPGV